MLENIKSIYFIGIGGVSMSALAVMLKKRGYIVKGSDTTLSPLTDKLESEGIEIAEGSSEQFTQECDAVVYTGAISQNDKDLLLANRLGKQIFTRADLLGLFSQEKKTISVAGTHGKTTTTGMIATILLKAGVDPTVHIGGELKLINSNFHIGKSDLFLTEACEYQDAFLSLKSLVSVVLNIEEDHLDYFKNFDNIKSSFNKFVNNTQQNGYVVYNFDTCKQKIDKTCLNHYKNLSFGLDGGADLYATNVIEYKKGKYSFDAVYCGKILGNFKLPCFGWHNIYNALASIGTCLCLGIDVESISNGLSTFSGVSRRMEIIQENSPLIIHDYAHHPQEIEATLKTIKKIAGNKVVCIFQPHTYTRTRALYREFIECFNLCDEIWLLPIYPAREKPIKGITSNKMKEDLIENGQNCKYFSSFEEVKSEIIKDEYKKSTFAVLGAGDIEKLAKMLSSQY